MGGVIYKPYTRKGPVLILPNDGPAPTMTLPDGRTITAVKGTAAGGTYKGHEGYQWAFPRDVLGHEGAILSVGGQKQKIGSTNLSWRGGSVGSLQPSNKTGANEGGGFAAGTAPGMVGEFGVVPGDLSGMFPTAATTSFEPIKGAAQDYQFVDPIKFGGAYGEYQRGELKKNYQQAQEFAVGALDMELSALQAYVPKSAALKREQISLDNTFNQAERTKQVNAAIPDVVADVNRVAADARTYASGEVPNDVVDRALELGVRSAAADVASTSGFGVSSSAARKTSDLMSAQERIKLSQYGEGLLSSNAAQRAQLFLAPTEYSNAGSQINVNPTFSGAQLQAGYFENINSQSLINAPTAFGSTIQQFQFVSGLDQQTQQFNAQATLQNDQFNATNQNQFALSFFNYLNSYAMSAAGGLQTDVNTGVALSEQEKAQQAAEEAKKDTQHGNTIKEGLEAIGAVSGVIGAISDKRLKENITSYNGALNDLDKLDVINYTYKNGTIAADGKKPHIGLIAQELQKVFPYMVLTHDKSGFLAVDPFELIFVLIAAVKELKDLIDPPKVAA